MSEKHQLFINDFNLFLNAMKSTAKMLESAHINVDQNGMSIYGARGRIARCEITTNAIYSDNTVQFSVMSLNTFVRVLQTVKDVHGDDLLDFKLEVDLPQVKFSSKKFKTKFQCCNDDVIQKWMSTKLEAKMTPVFEFTTSSDMIKQLNSHTYICENQESMRIYLETKSDMENNSLFASIGDRTNNLNNEMTLKSGIVTYGKLDGRNIILDLERLNLFNSIQSDSIKVSLMDINALVGKTVMNGKNGTFLNIIVYNSILKN